MSDAESLDRFGLLTRRTVLAHGNFVSDCDMDRIGERGAGVAHCPLSNVYFSDAVFPLRAALDKGVRVGLGTDISGGPSASMFDSCRMAVAASRMLESGVDAALAARTPRPRRRAHRFPRRLPSRDRRRRRRARSAARALRPRQSFRRDRRSIPPRRPARSASTTSSTSPRTCCRKSSSPPRGANIASVFVGGEPVAGAVP